MAKLPYPVTSKAAVRSELERLKFQLWKIPRDKQPFAVELRLRIAHYEAVLKNWIDGHSEHFFVLG